MSVPQVFRVFRDHKYMYLPNLKYITYVSITLFFPKKDTQMNKYMCKS